MVSKRIIPCLDIRDGRVVKGVHFEGLRDVDDPVALAARYNSEGADELVFYDITASAERRKLFTDVLCRVAQQVFIPLTVGGGISGVEDFERVLACGADKVSVNTGALANPSLIEDAARRYGSQCVVLSMDVKRVGDSFHIFARGGREDTGLDAIEWAVRGANSGAGELVVNSMDADGVKGGFDLEMLRAIGEKVSLPLIASGGAGNREHFAELFTLPQVDAGLAASVFHYGQVPIPELKEYLHQKGFTMRLASAGSV
ncbi:MAG: imidazole glycerol phosphate synthase subunit HisF [Oscillospiraceae bacterium]